MSSLLSIYKDFEEEAKYWLDELENYNDTPFQKLSPDNEYTMSGLYHYMTSYCIDFYGKAMGDAVSNKESKVEKGGKTFSGSFTFLQKKLTPSIVKKTNKSFSITPQELNVAEARSKVIQSMKLMLKLSKDIKGNESKKVKHPQLGWLTLKEWYKLPEWHFKYCYAKKDSIDKYIISRKGVAQES